MFSQVQPYIVPKPKAEVPRPDNVVFKLHYKVTFAILALASVMVSTYQYIDSAGSAIQCMFDKHVGIQPVIINRYCWIMGTFTLPHLYPKDTHESTAIFQGVGTHSDESDRKYHSYYQWVPLMLAVQAAMFYAPHWIWKTIENGRLKNIIVGLNKSLSNDNDRKHKVSQLADYMRERMSQTTEHREWALKFFFCECLNLVNVIGQIFITDRFLGGEFTTYGTEVLNFVDMDPEERTDPMSRVFPRMTKCIFHKFGGSGTIQRFDALCVLGMNILNEKVYIFIWFWFIALAVITGCAIVLRALQFFMPTMRDRLVKLENLGYLDRTIPRDDVERVVGKLEYADWLILYYLAQSMDKKNFGALISNLADDLPTYPGGYAPVKEDDTEMEVQGGEGGAADFRDVGNHTPPPVYELEKAGSIKKGELDEVDKNEDGAGAAAVGLDSGRSTLKSSDKLASMLRKVSKSSLK